MIDRVPFAARLVLPVSALELLLQLGFANGYGYHRDELYFRAAARHPAFGYDDQPPLTPLLGRLSESLFGESPRGLRVVSAVAVALVVVLVALLARELGAGATGQFVAAACTAASGFVVVVGHLLSTTTFDLIAWIAIVLLVARILGGGDERLWLAVGATAGLGLQNKHLPLLLVLALVMGLALDRRLVSLLYSRWLWAGAAIALAMWLPNLLWQALHGWPQLELAGDIREDEGGESRATLIPLQLVLVGPLLVPVWVAGLWALLRGEGLRPWRSLGFAYLVLLGLVLIVAGKPYYPAPLLVCLLAPGAIVVTRWLGSRARRALLAGAIVVTAAFSIVVGLPVIPVDRLQGTFVAEVNEDAIETVGWPQLVAAVGRVHAELPARERGTAVVLAGNYGEAGAVDRYGPALGLPPVYSGHNAYARFGMPEGSAGPVIVLGYGDPSIDFVDCRPAATVDNGVGLANQEQGGSIFVCRGPRGSWRDAWPSLSHLSA
ncbi:MAG TPA: glycosyltransferase family 39 protein [Gaiellaceae bacterium]|nr:glycosyltransferase family 39 protein [Gaiellaceae bacterium]